MARRATSLNKAQVRFIVRFAGLLVLFYVITTPKVVDRAVVAPFTRAITAVSTAALQVIGQDVSRDGTIIRGNGFAVDIKNGCNGIEALVFLCAAMFAFAAPLRSRLVGIVVGALAVEALNVVRIASLFLLGRYRPDLFETFHLAVWQSVIFGAAVLIFAFWTTRVRPIDAAATR
ncbi:MAG: exosortase H [Thermoanaerobaculia bacterium]